MINHFSFTSILLSLWSVLAIGCGHDDSMAVREGHMIKILYDEKPIGGVELRLYRAPYTDGNPTSYVGFSNTSGEAYVTPVGEDAPPIDSAPWMVAVLSDGDGSWMLDPKLGDPAKSAIELKIGAASGDAAPVIRLPSGAVRPLTR